MGPVTTTYGPAREIYLCERARDKRYASFCVHVRTLKLFPALRHRGAPRKKLVWVRQQRILKHDIVAPAGAAEGAQLCLERAGRFISNGEAGAAVWWFPAAAAVAAMGRRSALPAAAPTAAAATFGE